MKIFNAAQIRAWDQFTILHEPISSIDLMERAAHECTTWILENFKEEVYVVFCGTGNNGGDGLSIARKLFQKGKTIVVHIVGAIEDGSADFKTNLKRLVEFPGIEILYSDGTWNEIQISKENVVIDCLFGTGLNRPVEDWRVDVIHYLNASGNKIISIDLPSGMLPDLISLQPGAVVNAHFTLTFQQPKLSFFFPENHAFTGLFAVLDIGLHKTFREQNESLYHYITSTTARPLLKDRPFFSHKNQFGHLDVFAGSRGMLGAAILTSRAALRTGCGLVTAHIPTCGYEVFQSTLPEAMCVVDQHEDHLSSLRIDNKRNAVAVGPGIGVHEDTIKFLERFLAECTIPLVMDADALNIIASNSLQKKIPAKTIITPHPGEFDRLFGKHVDSFSRFETLKKQSAELGIIIVLKGAYTAVSMPSGDVFFNSTGNSGMSTAGSGDVLTGVIGSFLAQGYSPTESSLLGVYLHGLAGDICAAVKGKQGLLAGDFADHVPEAISQLRL